jgi:hypothetical protein
MDAAQRAVIRVQTKKRRGPGPQVDDENMIIGLDRPELKTADAFRDFRPGKFGEIPARLACGAAESRSRE